MLNAIIFDKDGVLTDTEPLHFKTHFQALSEQGIKISKEEYAKYGVGTTIRYFHERIAKERNKKIYMDKSEKRKQELFNIITKDNLKAIPEAVDLLKRIKGKYRLVVASTTPRKYLDRQLKTMKLDDFFEFIVSGYDDVEKSKPEPDIYFKTAELLNVRPSECLVIEDAQSGIRSAKAAGMKCIAYQNEITKLQDLSEADVVIDSLRKIDDNVIKKLSNL